MTVKFLLAAALVAAPVPAHSQSVPASYPPVRQVVCAMGKGSAVRIGPDTYVTAAHVAVLSGCTIAGEPMQVVELDGDLDFAILHTNRYGHGFAVNCDGFKAGQYYYGIGFAFGWPVQRMTLERADAEKHISGMTILEGEEMFIPGMSGGAVVDEHGSLVGIVNARNEEYHISFSRALQDTSLCPH